MFHPPPIFRNSSRAMKSLRFFGESVIIRSLQRRTKMQKDPFFWFDLWNLQSATLRETNSSHLKMDGWKTTFLLGWPIFRGYVGFREGVFYLLYVFTFQKRNLPCRPIANPPHEPKKLGDSRFLSVTDLGGKMMLWMVWVDGSCVVSGGYILVLGRVDKFCCVFARVFSWK